MTATPKPHILVVDDDPLTRMMATEALREGGFVTSEAEDGVRAVAAFEAGLNARMEILATPMACGNALAARMVGELSAVARLPAQRAG